MNLREAISLGVGPDSLIRSLKDFERTYKRLVMESQAEVRDLNACVDVHDRDPDVFRRSEGEAPTDFVESNGRHNDYVASNVNLKKSG